MKKLAAFIVKHCKLVGAIAVVLMILCACTLSWGEVEDDIVVYLADSAEAKKGMQLMEKEFITYATADIMVKGVTMDEAFDLADDFIYIDGISNVDFDDSLSHYKDESALYNIRFEGPAEQDGVRRSYNTLRKYLQEEDYEYYIYTESFETIKDVLTREMLGVFVIVMIVVVVVLNFACSTYAEVLVLILTFGVAALINMGSNFLLGKISFVSDSVSLVMQLALSVDYAIILCNRYKEKHETLPIPEALEAALTSAIPEIAASSLTTIAGLAAMTLMEFKLGLDLGIALIKAILISLLTVFFIMPVIIMIFGKWMDKTKHRNFIPKVPFMGKLAYKGRFIVPPIFLAVIVLAYIGFNNINYAYTEELVGSVRKGESDIAFEEIQAHFGSNKQLAVLVPAGDYEKEAALTLELEARPEVNSVLGLATVEAMDGYKLGDLVGYSELMELAELDETTAKGIMAYCAADRGETDLVTESVDNYRLPLIDLFLRIYDIAQNGTVELTDEQIITINGLYAQLKMGRDQLQGENYSRIILYVDLMEQGDETFAFLDYVHSVAETYYPEGVCLTAMSVAARDFTNTFKSDAGIVSTFSLVFVLLILLVTFRSIGMPILLVLIIQGSIWLNFCISHITGHYVYFMWYLIASAIQMGANIDYAIVISSRYRELRSSGLDKREAAMEAVNLSFPTIITSGLLMVSAGFLIGVRVSYDIISGMGLYIGSGTLISLFLVNFILPALLVFGDRFLVPVALPEAVKGKIAGKRRLAQTLVTGLLAASVIATLVIAPINLSRTRDRMATADEQTASLVSRAEELRGIALAFEEEEREQEAQKMEFAEHLLTDQIGTQQLTEGLDEYQDGEKTLEEFKALLADGEEQYREGLELYEEGLAEYRAGQAQVAAGQAEYDRGLAEYNAGKAKLAAGQAEYDRGVSALEAAESLMDAGQALLAVTEPLYDLVMPIYERYKSLQDEYDAMVAGGEASELQIGLKLAELMAAKALYESNLNGYSLGGLIEDIQKAHDMIADGDNQIALAKEQLAAGKAELDAGYAELAAAEEKLASGKRELNKGYAQLADGKAKLDDSWQQLQEARYELDSGKQQILAGERDLQDAQDKLRSGAETLEENRVKVNEDLATLDKLNSDREKLDAGISLFLSVDGVQELVTNKTSDAEICTIAARYFREQQDNLQKSAKSLYLVSIGLIIAAAIAGIAIVGWFLRKSNLCAALAGLGALLAIGGAILWRASCGAFGMLIFWIAAALALLAILAAEIYLRSRRGSEIAE